ncbi:peptidase M23-like protein [Mucilaginibacter gracilis]|uniref:Peptidase M23-like protein n=1 Tax=Mucilaginibacter gracilis TaxID=423350 RepID=A0A495JAH0_9SPHI|nr:peptidoglycan DD-metalloendopeptidase family protein [Mucilaginibacter gracilis]RKR85711.1 peptidase M23-like protein [Mucilaginibacter gracilis]
MNKHQQLEQYIARHPKSVGKVVFFDASRHNLLPLDFTSANAELTPGIISSTQHFSEWVFKKLKENKCKYGIGGYFEHRTLYSGSALFNTTAETRNLHLGVDIWGDAETTVYNPIAGKVHSFKDNNNKGDYGPTIILEHDLDGLKLYSLYGHLSYESLMGLHVGMPMKLGEPVGHFGDAAENGNWPPHLHFQLMFDMEGLEGDYPGACRPSEKEHYQQNIADPDLILRFPASNII